MKNKNFKALFLGASLLLLGLNFPSYSDEPPPCAKECMQKATDEYLMRFTPEYYRNRVDREQTKVYTADEYKAAAAVFQEKLKGETTQGKLNLINNPLYQPWPEFVKDFVNIKTPKCQALCR